MLKYKVYINQEFRDKYTGKLYEIGQTIEDLTQERINEINAVNKELISVISSKEENPKKDKSKEENPKTN